MFYIEQSSKLTISIEPSKHNSQYNTNKVPIQTRFATYFIALFPVNKSSGTILPKAKFNHATFCRPGILAIFETRKQL
jgi:hypothetical protein